jgi:hypothetical protein
MAKTLTAWGRLALGLPPEDKPAKVTGTRPATNLTPEQIAEYLKVPKLTSKEFEDQYMTTPTPRPPKIDRGEIRFRSMKAAIATDPDLLGMAASRNIGEYAKNRNSWPCRRDGDVINDLTEVCHKANYLRTNDGWHSDYVRKIEDVVRAWDEGHHEALVAAMKNTTLSPEQVQAIEVERKARLEQEREEKAEREEAQRAVRVAQLKQAKLAAAEAAQADLDNIVDVLEASEVGGEW